MKLNYYEIFRSKITEEEVKTPIDNESNLDKILAKPNKISNTLVKLLTTQKNLNQESKDQLREVISDIKCMSYMPTTFRIVIPNGNFFDLKYDPTPLELNYPEDFKPKDLFTVIASGKKFNIANNSEMADALKYINDLLQTKPVGKAAEPGDEAPKTGPEAPVEEPDAEAPPEEEEAPPEEEKK
jgi:hypothetical protein